jgi:hypothetical protein
MQALKAGALYFALVFGAGFVLGTIPNHDSRGLTNAPNSYPSSLPVAVKDEPDRDVVGLLGLASILSQSRGLLSRYPPQSRKFGRFHKLSLATFNMNQQLPLNVPKLLLRHPKIVPQFMYESLADLMAHFSLA